MDELPLTRPFWSWRSAAWLSRPLRDGVSSPGLCSSLSSHKKRLSGRRWPLPPLIAGARLRQMILSHSLTWRRRCIITSRRIWGKYVIGKRLSRLSGSRRANARKIALCRRLSSAFVRRSSLNQTILAISLLSEGRDICCGRGRQSFDRSSPHQILQALLGNTQEGMTQFRQMVVNQADRCTHNRFLDQVIAENCPRYLVLLTIYLKIAFKQAVGKR